LKCNKRKIFFFGGDIITRLLPASSFHSGDVITKHVESLSRMAILKKGSDRFSTAAHQNLNYELK